MFYKMETQETQQRRKGIRMALGTIIDMTELIENQMKQVPHLRRGVAYRSLKPLSGEGIVHSDDGFSATYRNSDGQLYTIQIYRRKQ